MLNRINYRKNIFVKKKYLTQIFCCCNIVVVVKGNYFTGDEMDKIFRQSMLYDFYGELLTEHQKSIYEDVVVNDLSYSEIARLNGVSRQGVYDLVKRCDNILEEYETKLKLVEKFIKARGKLSELDEMVDSIKDCDSEEEMGELIERIKTKSEEIFEEF